MAGAGGRSSFGGRSKIWLRLVQSLVSSFVVMTWMGPAQADTSYDPSGERMAWTDRFTTSDIQARVWLLTNGGGVAGPGHYLMTKAADVAIGGWVGAGLTGLDTGLDAVSWPDGTNQRERVFYVSSGQIYMLTFDNESFGNKTDCVSCALAAFGVTIQNTDLAAVTFVDGSRRVAVAGGCTSQSLSGYLCLCEGDLVSAWTCMKSSDRYRREILRTTTSWASSLVVRHRLRSSTSRTASARCRA